MQILFSSTLQKETLLLLIEYDGVARCGKHTHEFQEKVLGKKLTGKDRKSINLFTAKSRVYLGGKKGVQYTKEGYGWESNIYIPEE